MARLAVGSHPDRVFEDDGWRYGPRHLDAQGYLSIGDHGDQSTRYGELWAFAVEDPYASPDDPAPLYQEILDLNPPFLAAEVVMVGDTRFAIGFFPDPAEPAEQ